MRKFKRLAVFFFAIFILSASFSLIHTTRSKSLNDFDGSILRQTAVSELGNDGDEKYWKWSGFDSHTSWCACFVLWCVAECYDGAPKFASCHEFLKWFRGERLLYGAGAKPLPGMIVFFDWDEDGLPDHMGIVDRRDGEKVFVLEGNSGNKCLRNAYDTESSAILAYGAIL